MLDRLIKYTTYIVIASSMFLSACSTGSRQVAYSPVAHENMETCVRQHTQYEIEKGTFSKYSYAGIMKNCGKQYSALAVARHMDGLVELPYEHWQLYILKLHSEHQKSNASISRRKTTSEETEFLTSYYELQGRIVIVNTAMDRCPPQFLTEEMKVLLRQSNSEIVAILESVDDLLRLRDQELGSEIRSLIEEYRKTVRREFIKAVDGTFVPEKFAVTCPRAFNEKLTSDALAEFIMNLDKLDRSQSSTRIQVQVQQIKQRVIAVLSLLRSA